MNTKLRWMILGAWVLGPAMVLSAAFGVRFGDLVEALPASHAAAEAGSLPSTAKLSRDDAWSLVSADAGPRLAASLGSDRVVSGENGDEAVAATRFDGHPITLADLELREFRFAGNTKAISTAVGTSAAFGTPKNVWVATWEQTAATAEGWSDGAVVRVTVVLDDRTGEVLSAAVEQVQPADA